MAEPAPAEDCGGQHVHGSPDQHVLQERFGPGSLPRRV